MLGGLLRAGRRGESVNLVRKRHPVQYGIRTILCVIGLTVISLGWWVDHHRQQIQLERLQQDLELEKAIARERATRRFTGVEGNVLRNSVPASDALSRPIGTPPPH